MTFLKNKRKYAVATALLLICTLARLVSRANLWSDLIEYAFLIAVCAILLLKSNNFAIPYIFIILALFSIKDVIDSHNLIALQESVFGLDLGESATGIKWYDYVMTYVYVVMAAISILSLLKVKLGILRFPLSFLPLLPDVYGLIKYLISGYFDPATLLMFVVVAIPSVALTLIALGLTEKVPTQS